MKRYLNNPLFCSLSAAICLWAGWPSSPIFPFLFLGMALFLRTAKLLIEEKAKGFRFFGILYLGLLLWNILCTWWIYYATLGGVLMAVFANAALMTIPFFIYRLATLAKVEKLSLLAFLLSWLGFEYIHHNWSLSWPWLTLGNALSKFPWVIQWYEYTGTAGGSLWVLALAVLIFKLFLATDAKKILALAALLIAPIFLSIFIGKKAEKNLLKNHEEIEVVVLQPNFNTFSQKSRSGEAFIPYEEQLQIMLAASKKELTLNTKFLVWPETAISGSNRESLFYRSEEYSVLKEFLSAYPNLSLVAGIDSYEICKNQENPTQFASFSEYVGFYEPYNAALLMSKDTMAFYHKSKFVPGAEQVPFAWLIKPIEILLGGVGFGHFFGQETQTPFAAVSGEKAAPGICYESIFGEHMSKFVANNAQLIFIITNDDWWHDTEGHRQHFDYARLRAIETRIPIARSANTGFSGFFDALGRDYEKTSYRENACIKKIISLPKAGKKTFYTSYGDYIGKTALYLTALLLVSFLVKRYTPKL